MWHHVFLLSVSGLRRLWCEALLKLGALSDAVGFAFLSPSWMLSRQQLSLTKWKLCRADPNWMQDSSRCRLVGHFEDPSKDVQWAWVKETSTPPLVCFIKCRLWREVKASDRLHRSEKSSYSCLLQVKEGEIRHLFCVKQRNNALTCSPYDPWNTNDHKSSLAVYYKVCIWGSKQGSVCTFVTK